MEQLIFIVIILFLTVVLPAILQALAKRRAQQRGQQPPEAEPGEQESAYAASSDELQRYLESIGVRVERRPPPGEPPPVQPVPAEPAREEKVEIYLGPHEFEASRLTPTPAPPRPVARERPRRAPRRHRVEPLPDLLAQPTPVAEPAPELAQTHKGSPVKRPHAAARLLPRKLGPAEFKRAVILSEIIRRPDFQRLPIERDLF